jgi:stage II sporulation protein D
MRQRTGCCAVLDVQSGKVLAAHDLARAARTRSKPGSVIKPFSLLALLNNHRVGHATTLVCPRRLAIGDRRLHCSHPATAIPLDPSAAIAYSCNVYFAHFASGLRNAELAETLARVGLTAPTGLARGESTGWATVPSTSDQKQLQALGESNVEVTPLGIVAAYRKLALRLHSAEPPDHGIETIYRGLEDSGEYGTSRLARPSGLRIAGKTGTTSLRAWFAGYAPAARPAIAVVVFLEQGSGGGDAAPVAREIFQAFANSLPAR